MQPSFLGTRGAFEGASAASRMVFAGTAAIHFPRVKLLSRYVMPGAGGIPLRIVLKGLADAAGKAAMLVITVVAARRLNPDPFAILALAMATGGWLRRTDAGCRCICPRTAREPLRTAVRLEIIDAAGSLLGDGSPSCQPFAVAGSLAHAFVLVVRLNSAHPRTTRITRASAQRIESRSTPRIA